MTNYREILRLKSMGCSERNIALSCSCSRNTVSKVLKKAEELGLAWPLSKTYTNGVLESTLYPKTAHGPNVRKMPDFAYIRKELLKNGVTKKLLWTEYMEECRLSNEQPLMYSQFCYYIQKDEQKRRATMHIPRKPGEQVEVDWAGDPASIIDPDTGEITYAYLFVGVMSYSQYTFVEAFVNQKQNAWIIAHVHMYDFFGGVAPILVSDNCKTAVISNSDWYDPQLNTVYHEMAEHYGVAIIPARVRKPRDKPNVEGSVGNISTWITAALRNEQFFSLTELNTAIREKLEVFNNRPFQKKEGSRSSLFLQEELPLLASLPATPYEQAEWKQATVSFNYHISVDSMLYSVPFRFVKREVNIRITEKTIEVFCDHNRIASHRRRYGRLGQYATVKEHMPEDHVKYLEWDGNRFRKWAAKIGKNTCQVVDSILTSKRVEQQTYRSCMGLLKMAEKYSQARLEAACEKALSFTGSPSYKIVKNILVTWKDKPLDEQQNTESDNEFGITRGARYYGR